jgi:hypothetical protein
MVVYVTRQSMHSQWISVHMLFVECLMADFVVCYFESMILVDGGWVLEERGSSRGLYRRQRKV